MGDKMAASLLEQINKFSHDKSGDLDESSRRKLMEAAQQPIFALEKPRVQDSIIVAVPKP